MSKKLGVVDACGEEKVDPRVLRTRQLIINALKELLREGRFADITVQDIAERATVNRATFYSHFEDKFALLEHMMSSDLRKKLISKVERHSPLDRPHLKTLTVAVFEFLGQMHTSCTHKREFGPVFETTLQEGIQDFLLHWMHCEPRAEITRGQPPEVVASIYSWAIFGAANSWSRLEKRPNVEDAVQQLLTVLMGEA